MKKINKTTEIKLEMKKAPSQIKAKRCQGYSLNTPHDRLNIMGYI